MVWVLSIKRLTELSKEIAKPLRRSDSTLEYLPTQYISEFVKSQGYDGSNLIVRLGKVAIIWHGLT